MQETVKYRLLVSLKLIVIIAILIVCVRNFTYSAVTIDGASMMPTYEDGDRVIINKLGKHFSDFERFHVIVFEATVEKKYIKRIIGLPGDSIAYKNDVLYVNGEPYPEPFLDAYKHAIEAGKKLTPDFTLQSATGYTQVPPGHVFVLGDNRRNSADSRHIGFVPIDKIVGEASIRFYPMETIGIVK